MNEAKFGSLRFLLDEAATSSSNKQQQRNLTVAE